MDRREGRWERSGRRALDRQREPDDDDPERLLQPQRAPGLLRRRRGAGHGLVPQQPASVDPATGDVRTADGKTVRADYALAEPQVELSGEEVARDPTTGLVLYRMPGDRGSCARPCRGRLPGLVDRARGDLHALALPRRAAHRRHCEPARPVHDSPDRDGCLRPAIGRPAQDSPGPGEDPHRAGPAGGRPLRRHAARHPDRRPCPSARHAGHPQPWASA